MGNSEIIVVQSEIGWKMAFDLILGCVFLHSCWSYISHVVEVIFTEMLSFEDERNSPARLVYGLQSSSAIIKNLALQDLVTVSQRSAYRRATIYEKQTWSEIRELCLNQIERLASDLEDGCRLESLRASEKEMLRRELQQTDVYARQRGIQYCKRYVRNRLKIVSLDLKYILFTNKGNQFQREVFVELQRVLWCIKAVSNLVVKSLKEDVTGVVQRADSLKIVLNSLLRTYIAVEQWISSPSKQINPFLPQLRAHRVLRAYPYSLMQALTIAIYSIVVTFYEHISAVRFPSSVYCHPPTIYKF